MQLNADQLRALEVDGYLFLPSRFSAEEVRVLRDHRDEIFKLDRQEIVREKLSGVPRTAFAAQLKLMGFKGTAAPKPFTDVTGSRAFVTAKVTFQATMSGKPITEEGTWTFVAAKSGTAWKITSMAWGTLHH